MLSGKAWDSQKLLPVFTIKRSWLVGFAITWCAVREEGAEKFLQKLGLAPTGETEEFPESLIASGMLDTGWRVIYYNNYGCPFITPQHLTKLSIDQDAILCLVEEHAMASSSELWSGGRRQWYLSHEGENGPKGLSVGGHPPESLTAIRQEMEALQLAAGGDDAQVDYIFEIPLKIAQSIVGFKHDEKCDHLIGGHYVVMTRVAPKSSLLSRLFGVSN
jgi:hypothetical protein